MAVLDKSFDNVKKELGENITKLRTSRGYSQQQFAEILGVSQSAVSAWELNTREMYLSTIWAIANTFKVPVTSLLPVHESNNDDDFVQIVAEHIKNEPKWRSLFEKLDKMNPEKQEAIFTFIEAITKD